MRRRILGDTWRWRAGVTVRYKVDFLDDRDMKGEEGKAARNKVVFRQTITFMEVLRDH